MVHGVTPGKVNTGARVAQGAGPRQVIGTIDLAGSSEQLNVMGSSEEVTDPPELTRKPPEDGAAMRFVRQLDGQGDRFTSGGWVMVSIWISEAPFVGRFPGSASINTGESRMVQMDFRPVNHVDAHFFGTGFFGWVL